MNLANVRSAIGAMLALAVLALATVPPARVGAARAPTAGRVIAVLPYETTVEEIAAVDRARARPGQRRAGSVPVAQTFLDMSQGNRVNEDLYDGDLPRLYLPRRPGPAQALGAHGRPAPRAPPPTSSPACSRSTLEEAGVPVAAEADSGLATLIAVDRDGAVRIAEPDACESRMRPRAQRRAGPGSASSTGSRPRLAPTTC